MTGIGNALDTSTTNANGIVTWNGTNLVNYAGPQISSAGIQTNTTQIAFDALLSAGDSNATGNGATYTLGSGSPLTVTQQGSAMSTAGVFTAPVSGFYLFTCHISLTSISAGMTSGAFSFLVGGVNPYGNVFINPLNDSPGGNLAISTSALIFVTATNTVTFVAIISGGAGNTVNVAGGGFNTAISGALIC